MFTMICEQIIHLNQIFFCEPIKGLLHPKMKMLSFQIRKSFQ